jgi:hypothetical protein
LKNYNNYFINTPLYVNMMIVTSSGSFRGGTSGGGAGRYRHNPYQRRRNAWARDNNNSDDDEAIEVDMDDGNDLAMEAIEEEEDVAKYEPLKLPSRSNEREELQDAQKRSECFGCVYVGERSQASIPYEDILNIINIARQSMARTDLATMAIHMAKRYAKLRRDINRNLLPGEDPLPEWKASTILGM